MTSSDFLLAFLYNTFLFDLYPLFFKAECFFDWFFQDKFAQQDLASSLLKPASNSCRLNNGRHTASKQVTAVLLTLPSHKSAFAYDLCDFVTSSVDSLSSISLTLTCFLSESFSLAVHHLGFTASAA